MNYRLSPHTRIEEREGGIYLVSRAPLAILRINPPLRDLVQRAAAAPLAPSGTTEGTILEQLAERGFLERLREPGMTAGAQPSVSIIIPVKDRAEELERCLVSLALLTYPADLLQVIVVDDGSSDGSAEIAQRCGALVIPSGGTGRGPAAARNVGARAATGEILAFIDSDCTASERWLDDLIPAFSDPRTAAVGGLVDGMCRESAVDRYESVMSSLALGARERSGNSGDDTFYLPSCNLLVRRLDFAAAGGFRDEMHVGEDVDLTWRLRDNGRTITYLPVGRVYHEHRSSVRSFMSRRFDYGTSEGILQRLHPQRRKRMVIPPLLALLLGIAAVTPLFGWWSLAALFSVLAVDSCLVSRRLSRHGLSIPLRSVAAGRLRAMSSLAYYVSFHAVRYYSLPAIVAALFIPWLWLPYLAAVFCAAGVDHHLKKPPLPFIVFTAIYLLEHLSYGSGVFYGCVSRRCFSSYRVVVLRQVEAGA